jgi:hypothetical protein
VRVPAFPLLPHNQVEHDADYRAGRKCSDSGTIAKTGSASACKPGVLRHVATWITVIAVENCHTRPVYIATHDQCLWIEAAIGVFCSDFHKVVDCCPLTWGRLGEKWITIFISSAHVVLNSSYEGVCCGCGCVEPIKRTNVDVPSEAVALVVV